MKHAPEPGTIQAVTARLQLWCSRSDHGFIRIIFDDAAARDAVIHRLRAALPPGTRFHDLALPPLATPERLAERLADELARFGPGVISITGIELSLPPTATGRALQALNARRESFIHPGQHLLWWFPRHHATALIRHHHDLNSWFLKRADLTETLASPPEREVQSQRECAAQLKDHAHYQESEKLCREILAKEEARLGPDHPRVAIDLNNLAQLLRETNRLAEAEPLMRRALVINEARLGPDHPNVAIGINNLASVLRATSRLAEAETLYRRALAIDEANYGVNHPKVAIRLNNLGSLLKATNRLMEAEPLMRRALAIFEASYGPEHPEVATALNNLAGLLQDTNRLAEAVPLMLRALIIDEASFGPEHPKVATDLNNLAQLLQATNRLAEAEPLMRRAVGIIESSYGPEHPNVAIALNNLAALLKATNRLAEAEPLMRRAAKLLLLFTQRTGYPHHQLQMVMGNYHDLLKEMGLTEEAIQQRMEELLAEVEADGAP